MSAPWINNIGAYIKTLINVLSIAASAEVDGAAVQINGVGADYQSAQLTVAVGAVAGAPTSFSVAADIQTSADGATNWQALPSPDNVAITPITAANSSASVNVNLRGNLGYIRAQVVPTFVGGTTPSVVVAATIALGGSNELPAV